MKTFQFFPKCEAPICLPLPSPCHGFKTKTSTMNIHSGKDCTSFQVVVWEFKPYSGKGVSGFICATSKSRSSSIVFLCIFPLWKLHMMVIFNDSGWSEVEFWRAPKCFLVEFLNISIWLFPFIVLHWEASFVLCGQ